MADEKLANAYNKYLKKRKSQKIHDRFIRLGQKNINKRQNPSKVTYAKQERYIIAR